jgi:hypothetical protein
LEDNVKEKSMFNEMEVMLKHLNKTVSKLKEISAGNKKIIKVQVDFYGKIIIGGYVYHNYRQIGNMTLFYSGEAILQSKANKISI